MRVYVVLIALPAVMFGSRFQMSVTGPEQAEPARSVVREVLGEESGCASDALPLMPGWPVRVPCHPNFSPSRGAALADLDGDGRLEVICGSTSGRLYVWRYDGTPFPGWPRSLSAMNQYAPAVADVDLDGEYEIAVTTRGMTSGGQVYLFSESGANEPGWPVSGLVGGNFSDSPTLADIDGDDTLEVIVGERDYPVGHLHVLRHDGKEQPGAWPCSLDHVPAMGAAVADINLDRAQEIIYSSYNSLYAFMADGSMLPGWPVTMPNGRNFSYQSPALADVDGDDTLEIFVALHKAGGGCYAFRHDGTVRAGWPAVFPRWTYCPPTVADLYRDGELKVVCGLQGIIGGTADVLYAYDDKADTLAGFPVFGQGGAECNMTVADVDGDADMEVIYTSNMMTSADSLGYLYAVHHDGSPVSGWPLRPRGFTYLNGATVADVDGDDSLDIIAVSACGGEMDVTIWEAGVPFSRMSWEWPTYQFDMRRTGRYRTATTALSGQGLRPCSGSGFRMSPNPARAGQSVEFTTGNVRLSSAELYDRGGRILERLELQAGACRLPEDLVPGVYFARVRAGALVLHSLKLVVE
ncbi:MAG: VCBS repeat-containing protein [candidate division WOR-3 bacterium]|nr:MAG: VCBS repeat-containing protein [candidate division WOR-3 bacterium]